MENPIETNGAIDTTEEPCYNDSQMSDMWLGEEPKTATCAENKAKGKRTMKKIHPKTAARAKLMGIRLTEEENGDVTAKCGKHTVTLPTAKEAMKEIEEIIKNDPDRATTCRALALAKPGYKAKGDVNNCGDWLAKLLKDNFLDDEGKKKAVFQMDDFITCLKENDVAVAGRWAENRNKGWEGRFRMNGRQKLESVVARDGGMKIDGEFHRAPNTFIKEMRARHPEATNTEEEAA